MNGAKLELTNQITEEVWNRQKAMCGLCGKKLDENAGGDNIEYDFHRVGNSTEETTGSNIILLCDICHNGIGSELKNNGSVLLKRYHFPYANFNDYSSDRIFEDLKEDIEKLAEMSKDIDKYNYVKSGIKDKGLLLKNYYLNSDQVAELQEILNSATDNIKAIEKDRREKAENVYTENFEKIKSRVDEAVASAENETNFKKARQILLEAQMMFKDIRLKRDQREKQYSRIQNAFELLNNRQIEEREKYEMECIENYHNIKSEVDRAVAASANATNFKKAREALIKAQSQFKGLKLKRDQREEQYSRIQNAFEELNARQSEERAQYEKECAENYERLRVIVDDAIKVAEASETFKEARETLIAAQKSIRGVKLKRGQRDELYAAIREVFDGINRAQEEQREAFLKECDENYNTIVEKLNKAREYAENSEDFRFIRDNLIAVQNEVKILKLKRDQRNELFQAIRDAFGVLDRRRDEYRKHIMIEKREKLKSIKEDLERKIARVEESLQRDEESVAQLRDEFEKAESDEAKNEISAKIESAQGRTTEKREKIEETRNRIVDIDKELEKLEK
jgi:hypothetical protein